MNPIRTKYKQARMTSTYLHSTFKWDIYSLEQVIWEWLL